MAAKYTTAQVVEISKIVIAIMSADKTISLTNAVTLAGEIYDAVTAVQA